MYIVLPYIKKCNEVGRTDKFLALLRKLSFLPTEVDNFDIRQHYVRILFIFHCLICCVLLYLTLKNMISSIWKWISCCNDVMNHVDCVIKRDVYLQKTHLCSKNISSISFFVLKISRKNISYVLSISEQTCRSLLSPYTSAMA